eukprot:1145391-Pelagomonas_calceolata.AAC.3
MVAARHWEVMQPWFLMGGALPSLIKGLGSVPSSQADCSNELHDQRSHWAQLPILARLILMECSPSPRALPKCKEKAHRCELEHHCKPAPAATCRPKDVSNYVLAFNAKLGQLVQDHELQHLGLQPPPPPSLLAGSKGGLPQVEKEQRQAATREGRGQSLEVSVTAAGGGLWRSLVHGCPAIHGSAHFVLMVQSACQCKTCLSMCKLLSCYCMSAHSIASAERFMHAIWAPLVISGILECARNLLQAHCAHGALPRTAACLVTCRAPGEGTLHTVKRAALTPCSKPHKLMRADTAGVAGAKGAPLFSAPSSASSSSDFAPPQPPSSSAAGSGASTRSSSYDSDVSWSQQQQQESAEGVNVHSGSGSSGGSSSGMGGDGNGAGDVASKIQGVPSASAPVLRVLCGHSLGGICAALQALSSIQEEQNRDQGLTEMREGWTVVDKESLGPKKVAGLILVAPAILAGGNLNVDGGSGTRLDPLTDPLPLYSGRQDSYQENGDEAGQHQAVVLNAQTKQEEEHQQPQQQQQNQQQGVHQSLGHEGEIAFGSNVQRYINSSCGSSSRKSDAPAVQPPATPGARIRAALLNGVLSMARGALLLGVLLTLQ